MHNSFRHHLTIPSLKGITLHITSQFIAKQQHNRKLKKSSLTSCHSKAVAATNLIFSFIPLVCLLL